VHATEAGRIWIVGNTNLGVRHGVYALLDHLGYRWYLPGDAWTIVPRVAALPTALTLCDAPVFKGRNFFGTGGFGGKLPVDPDRALQQRWERWKQRNRLGGEYSFGGHSYQSFVLTHKAELAAHPEYLAEVDGKRTPGESESQKLCYANPGLQALFTQDRLAVLRRAVKADPEAPGAFAVSVDPSDGGGHCECAECRKLGSISDRVFTLANVVARAVAQEFPGRCVNLYGYHQHAAPPAFALEPNVFVNIIPYGFQRTGLTPEEFIAAWKAKAPRLGLYDYWAIPDWDQCLPLGPARCLAKVRLWHQMGVESFMSESVYSAGSAGLTWYLAARVLWNPAVDERPLTDAFFDDCFGPAAVPVRRLMERWHGPDFSLTEQELALASRDLAEATRLAAGQEPVLARLDDLKRYAIYLQYWHEYQLAEAKSPARLEAARRVIRHSMRCYDSAMVASFRMMQLVASRYEASPELKTEWLDYKGPGWTTVTPLARPELDELIAAASARYQPLDYEPRSFSADLVPLHETLPAPAPALSANWFFMGTHEFALWVPAGQTSVTLKIHFRKWQEQSPPDRLMVTDPAGQTVFDERYPGDDQQRTIVVPTATPGLYRATLRDAKQGFTLFPTADVRLALVNHVTSASLSPRAYFFVPRGLKRIVLRGEIIPQYFRLLNADGQEVPVQGERLLWVDVPPGQDGHPWSVRGYKSYEPLRLLNCPQVFAFTPETLLIPRECR
jgi:hypothetical protein